MVRFFSSALGWALPLALIPIAVAVAAGSGAEAGAGPAGQADGGAALATRPAAPLAAVAGEPAAQTDDSGGYTVTSVDLRNAGFDAPPEAKRPCPTGWFCTVHANPNAFRFEVVSAPGGNRYLRVSRLLPEPWALGRQAVPVSVRPGDRLRLSMLVNNEAVEGVAGPKIVLNDGTGNALKTESALWKPSPGWRRIGVEIEVVPGTSRAEVGFLIEGGGVTLLDDVRLDLLSAKSK